MIDPAILAEQDAVGISGDWHGDTAWVRNALQAAHAAECRVILHAGDFGFWPRTSSGQKFLRKVDRWCELLNIDILVTAGNHEDHSRWSTDRRDLRRIHLLPRACRLVIGSRTVVSMMGAASIDRAILTPGVDWFPEELPTADDVWQAGGRGGVADILITHEAPLTATSKVAMGRVRSSDLPSEVAAYAAYAATGAARVQELANLVQPRIHAHGHWHTPESQGFDEHDGIRAHEVLSLGMNGQRLNLVKLQLADLSWSPIIVEGER